MICREYLARQATTLLRLARTVKDPQMAAGLAEKAADLKDRLDALPVSDATPLAPDVEPPR